LFLAHSGWVVTIEEVAKIIPAGMILDFVFSGIVSAKDRTLIGDERGRSHLKALFKGVSLMRDNLLYRMVFAGPATVLAGYNLLLQLAGAKPDEFLPEGTWQFYVEFGLREDPARHQNETVGFQRYISQQSATFNEAQQLAAWLLALSWVLRAYEGLIGQLWEENTRLRILEETTGLTGLLRQWEVKRPYKAGLFHLLQVRKAEFDVFCRTQLDAVSEAQQQQFEAQWDNPTAQEERRRLQKAYISQMTIHRWLEAGDYNDERKRIELPDLRLAVVYRNNYYIVPLLDVEAANVGESALQLANSLLLRQDPPLADADMTLIAIPRAAQAKVRVLLEPASRTDLDKLRAAPIILNWDAVNAQHPLSDIRVTSRRGVGDHALSIFRSESSMIFDFSHIFFDGPWAMAMAEILTNSAVVAIEAIEAAPVTVATSTMPLAPLALQTSPEFLRAAAKYPPVLQSVSAEYKFPIAPLRSVRRVISTRTPLNLTINDLLVLYRSVFNHYYEPSDRLIRALNVFRRSAQGAALAKQVDAMLAERKQINPSLLIPIDASRVNPKERIFPSPFRNPLTNFHTEHQNLWQLYEQAKRPHLFGSKNDIETFYAAREHYLGALSAFNKIISLYRSIALEGKTMSATAIRLIAGLPGPVQRLADGIPGQVAVVNDVIKGEEVFSNVGQVVKGASITRFASAKDDNDKKVLVWGIMTDDRDLMVITLRDFRPVILELSRQGYTEIAQLVTQDFLQGYCEGLIRFVNQMEAILTASKRR
jgi:hypothetical protein